MHQDELLKVIAEATARQTAILEKMAGIESSETKDATGHMTAQRLHGNGGLFATPGLERDVITAHIRPSGIATAIPLFPSVSEDPRYMSITGFTADVGAEPDESCDDAPYTHIKGCKLTARFGLARRDTKEIEMDKVMLKTNRGDFTDLLLRGRVLGLSGLTPSGLNEGQITDIITMSEMVQAGVSIERRLAHLMWQGNYAVIGEFPGLDSQIATGIVDADTNVTCPALDSYVDDYHFAELGANIVERVSMMHWYLQYNADRMGLAPVSWVFVMRPELWFELSAIWPCAYNTNRCAESVTSNSVVSIDGRENVAERDAMRNGMYLVVNGVRIPVIVDNGIFEETPTTNAHVHPGDYASNLYMVPLTIQGSFPVTYREFIDYKGAATDTGLLRGMERYFWTDNGLYSWAMTDKKWCYQLHLKTEQRIVLRTPQLAGRIDDILYIPVAHLREPFPESPYFKDGGNSLGVNLPHFHAVWNSRGG